MFSGSLVGHRHAHMRPDGARVDFEAWARLVDFHLENGTSGIVVGGSTGESATLRDTELREADGAGLRKAGAAAHTDHSGGGHEQHRVDCRACRLAMRVAGRWCSDRYAGLQPTDAGGLVPALCGCGRGFPETRLFLYNVPSRTAVDMLPATVGRLSQLPRIVSVKEAVTEPGRVRALIEACRQGFAVLSGDDATAGRAVEEGARGVISVTANVAPRVMADMIDAGLRGDRADVEKLDAPLGALHRDLFVEANPIPVKWALARMGLIGEGIRLPLTPLSAAAQAVVLAALRSAGVVS